ISWLIGIKQGFHFSLGKNYKFMKQYVPEELWERLMSTYNMDSYPHMWEYFEQCMALFREDSSAVACQMDYQSPPYYETNRKYVRRQTKEEGIEYDNKEISYNRKNLYRLFNFEKLNTSKSERARTSTLRDWPPCPPIQWDGGWRSRPGVNPFISALTVTRCPVTFPGV